MPVNSRNTPPDSTHSLSSTEKKRVRDRKAQKTQRDKRESRIKALESRVEFCERNHGIGPATEWAQELLANVVSLREENERLRARQERVKGLVREWEVEDRMVPVRGTSSGVDGGAPSAKQGIMGTGTSVAATVLVNPTDARMDLGSSSLPNDGQPAVHLPELPTALSTIQMLPSAVPAWSLLPMREYSDNPLYNPQWLARADLIAACPPQPSPLDLLHGTRRNFLADQINRAVRRRALRDSECLALGWLVYLFSKWLVTPNPATFSRLATFQQPIMAQLQHGHPAFLDMIIWPQIRMNLHRHWRKYDFAELVGYFSCCVKVRWPWGVDVLERDEEDVLQMKKEFFDVFFQESGWGLTAEFIDKFPELFEGMDVEAVRFHMALPDVSDLGA